jgi:parvulin-like peptidyl-prolyl isomerase
MEMVTKEQGVSQDQYMRDSVWPSAALKKLTAQDVKVTEEDIQKGFEANYGERVRCRAIVLGNMRRAQEVWDKARRNSSPDYFGDLAEEYSIEPTSKALRGEVPPLGRHGGQPQLEDVAFKLQPGQLSGVIQVMDKFVILRCEGRTERVDVDEKDVRDILYRDIYEKKLRMAMGQKYEEIHDRARIDNYLAGTSHEPEKPAAAREQAGVRQDVAVQPTAGVR